MASDTDPAALARELIDLAVAAGDAKWPARAAMQALSNHCGQYADIIARWALEQHEEAVAARSLLDKICDAPLQLEIVKQEAERLRERVRELEAEVVALNEKLEQYRANPKQARDEGIADAKWERLP